MLPVLIGAVIGAVAYSCLKDDDSSSKETSCLESCEEEEEINLEDSAEALKGMIFKARKKLFALREEALARNDLETVRKMDEKLKEMEECMDKATQVVESLLEKYKEGAALSDNKEKAFGASYGIKQAESAEKKAPPDIIDEIYVRGKKVQPEQFVDAVVSLLNERTKKEQAET